MSRAEQSGGRRGAPQRDKEFFPAAKAKSVAASAIKRSAASGSGGKASKEQEKSAGASTKAALLLSTASTIRIATSSDDDGTEGTPANPINLDTPPPPAFQKIDFRKALLEGKASASSSTKSPAKTVNAGAEQKSSASGSNAAAPATNISANDVSIIGEQDQELKGNTSGSKAEGKRKLPVKSVSGGGEQGERDQQRDVTARASASFQAKLSASPSSLRNVSVAVARARSAKPPVIRAKAEATAKPQAKQPIHSSPLQSK